MGVRLDVSRLRMGVRLDVSRLRMGVARSRLASSDDSCERVCARTLFDGRRSCASVDAGRRLKRDDTDLNVFETLRFTALSTDPVFLKNDGFLATGRRSCASVDACELVRARTLFGGRRSCASVDACEPFGSRANFVCWRRMIIFFLLRLRDGATQSGTHLDGIFLGFDASRRRIRLCRIAFFAFLILGGVTLRLLERLLRLDLERLRLLLAGIMHTCSSSVKGL
jgi:hypothetical protein